MNYRYYPMAGGPFGIPGFGNNMQEGMQDRFNGLQTPCGTNDANSADLQNASRCGGQCCNNNNNYGCCRPCPGHRDQGGHREFRDFQVRRAAGISGAQRPQGATGPQGVQGYPGPQGVQGPRGFQGATRPARGKGG